MFSIHLFPSLNYRDVFFFIELKLVEIIPLLSNLIEWTAIENRFWINSTTFWVEIFWTEQQGPRVRRLLLDADRILCCIKVHNSIILLYLRNWSFLDPFQLKMGKTSLLFFIHYYYLQTLIWFWVRVEWKNSLKIGKHK